MEQIRKLPIGVQDFEKLITDGYLYVDKTEYIYNLINCLGRVLHFCFV